MARLNNFSVLPWYIGSNGKDEQDFRKWWVYGHIYPLYANDDYIIPSQIERAKYDGYNPDTRIIMGSSRPSEAIGNDGWTYISPGNTLWDFGDISAYDGRTLRIINPKVVGDGMAWVITDDGEPIAMGTGSDIPVDMSLVAGTSDLIVQWITTDGRTDTQLWLLSVTQEPVLPVSLDLYTPDGTFVRSMWKKDLWTAKRVGNLDYLITTRGVYFNSPIDIGQYYFKVSDGRDVWYSDVFTVVANTHDFISIEWYDEDDFVMDAGRIVYKNPTFINELFLRADIAKPKYEFEEEGETRDGLFQPVKQISKKVYTMHTLATEYLLDVMRFIRMADYVTIKYYPQSGNMIQTLYARTFLLTPEWEAEGDIASVAIEFETDTIAKKIGLEYIRMKNGDFNSDYNNDFDNE